MSEFKPLVYEWDHARNRYVTPGDCVECLKERVVAADDYVTMKEELRDEVEAHKRSRQLDANEARSREQELCAEVESLKAVNRTRHDALREARAEVERLRAALQRVSDFDPDGTRPCEIAREALGISDPTPAALGVAHAGCSYLGMPGMICNKCGALIPE